MRSISFEQAKSLYPHRYTQEHVPFWARDMCDNQKYYAPQYKNDLEWYENTIFYGEKEHYGPKKYCISNNPSWPLGQWLEKPYTKH